MKKVLIFLISFLFIADIKAAPAVSIYCPEASTINSTIKCTLKIKSDTQINGISFTYDFENNFKFVSFIPESGFEPIKNDETTLDIKTESSKIDEFTIGTLNLKFLKAGTFSINNIRITSTDNNTYKADKLTQELRLLSEDNTLKSLSINPGTLSPTFDSKVYEYKATVNSSSITITSEANDLKATVQKTAKQTLKYGENIINIVVKSESGSEKIYKIIITRPDSRNTNVNLKNVSLSVGNIKFKPETSDYTIKIDKSVETLTLNAELENSKSSFEKGYEPREIKLEKEKTITELRVKSESGLTKIYTFTFIKVDHELSSNNNIQNLVLVGYDIEFNTDKLLYDVNVKEDKNLEFKIALEDGSATYELINSDLKNGNTVVIKVIAENGDEKEYKFNIISEKKDSVITDVKEDIVCSQNSIIYYLIVFFAGVLITFLVTSLIYQKKIRNLKDEHNKEFQRLYHPVSEKTEILNFDYLTQNKGYNNKR